jgi:hypothetical protein
MKTLYVRDDTLARMMGNHNYNKFRIGPGDTHYRPNRLDWAACWAIAAFARFLFLPDAVRSDLWGEVA